MIRRTLTKRPGQKRRSALAIVARSFTVPLPSATVLSRKVSSPAARLFGLVGQPHLDLQRPAFMFRCTAVRSFSGR